MPARNFQSATGYRFGFNGKESDFEIHNSGGTSYDFGMRVYDPRLGKWLSVDPENKSFPSESPYIFGGDNPNYFIDPNGAFKVPIHRDITYDAYAMATGKSKAWARGQFFGDDLAFGAGEGSDWVKPLSDGQHFDGMDYAAIQTNWAKVNNEIDNITIGGFNKTAGGYDVSSLGQSLHSVQDFYSHSNYVELYLDYYKKTNGGNVPVIGEIPTYDEVMNNTEKYGAFHERLKSELHTGVFGGISYVRNKAKDILNAHNNGHDHHDDLAKDNLKMGKWFGGKNGAVNTHKAARDLATRHSAKIIKKKLN